MEVFVSPTELASLRDSYERELRLVRNLNSELYSLRSIAEQDKLPLINQLISQTDTLITFLSRLSSATGDISADAIRLSREIASMLDDGISAASATKKAFEKMGNI